MCRVMKATSQDHTGQDHTGRSRAGPRFTSRFTHRFTLGFPTLALFAVMALVCLAPIGSARADAMGPVCVESGDTLVVNGRRAYRACHGGQPVMLYGIAAPDLEQSCQYQGKDWACGREAASTLLRMTMKRTVTCIGESYDRENRLIAVCHAGGVDLNATMVRLGLAVSVGTRYAREEGLARADRAGMWMGTFDRPGQRSRP